MRLLTWNIHKGIGGVDRRYALGRITEVLRHHDADLVLLQEVDEGVPRSAGDGQAELLAGLLGYAHHAFAPNVRLTTGRYGNATLSRFPIARSRNIDLTLPLKKRRGGLFTTVEVPWHGRHYAVHVVNLHLGLASVERRWQLRRLLGSPTLAALDAHSRLIVAGDFNDWSGALGRHTLRAAGFACATGVGAHATTTFPAFRPVGPLDRVFHRGALRRRAHFRSRLALARQASDHLPLIVDFELVTR